MILNLIWLACFPYPGMAIGQILCKGLMAGENIVSAFIGKRSDSLCSVEESQKHRAHCDYDSHADK